MKMSDQLRRMGVGDDQIATARCGGRLLTEIEDVPKRSDGWAGYRSKWESLYAMLLDDMKASGEILDWRYEAVTLRLTESAIVDGKRVRAVTYTPDFCLWFPDGRRRYIEIKGYRRTKDINRFKQARDQFRHDEFLMLRFEKGNFVRMPY